MKEFLSSSAVVIPEEITGPTNFPAILAGVAGIIIFEDVVSLEIGRGIKQGSQCRVKIVFGSGAWASNICIYESCIPL